MITILLLCSSKLEFIHYLYTISRDNRHFHLIPGHVLHFISRLNANRFILDWRLWRSTDGRSNFNTFSTLPGGKNVESENIVARKEVPTMEKRKAREKIPRSVIKNNPLSIGSRCNVHICARRIYFHPAEPVVCSYAGYFLKFAK